MWSAKSIISLLAGLSLLSIPSGAVTATFIATPSTPVTSVWQVRPTPRIPANLAQEEEPNEWHYHHHHDRDQQHQPFAPNDYNWGSPHRYQYAPHWFNNPPPSWSADSRRAYLKERRQVAIKMQQQMLARGDTNAAQRLGAVIGQLDHQLGFR
jgi:hypothetical protein